MTAINSLQRHGKISWLLLLFAGLVLLTIGSLLFVLNQTSTVEEKLIAGVRYSELDEVRAALAAGANPNLIVEETGQTILAFAMSRNNTPAALTLIDSGASLNNGVRSQAGEELLMVAVTERSLPLVKAILEKDSKAVIKAEQPPSGLGLGISIRAPLVIAIEKDRPDIVEVLLRHGAKVNNRYGLDNYTPLMIAAKIGSPTVELLLKNGANPLLKNAQGETALELARQYNHHEASRAIEKWLKQSKSHQRK